MNAIPEERPRSRKTELVFSTANPGILNDTKDLVRNGPRWSAFTTGMRTSIGRRPKLGRHPFSPGLRESLSPGPYLSLRLRQRGQTDRTPS
jgi:hypothetical protein